MIYFLRILWSDLVRLTRDCLSKAQPQKYRITVCLDRGHSGNEYQWFKQYIITLSKEFLLWNSQELILTGISMIALVTNSDGQLLFKAFTMTNKL